MLVSLTKITQQHSPSFFYIIIYVYHYILVKKNSKINNGIQNENDKSTQQKPYSQLNILFLFISIPLKNMYLRLNNQTPNQKE